MAKRYVDDVWEGSSQEGESPAKRVKQSLCTKCEALAAKGGAQAVRLLQYRCRACPSLDETERAVLLVEAGLDVNTVSESGTMLSQAAAEGLLDLCAFLLDHGASTQTPHDALPLALASWEGHAATARLLLAHGADPDALDSTGRTALMGAAAMGHREVCDELLDRSSQATAIARDRDHNRTCADWAGYMGFHDLQVYLTSRLA